LTKAVVYKVACPKIKETTLLPQRGYMRTFFLDKQPVGEEFSWKTS